MITNIGAAPGPLRDESLRQSCGGARSPPKRSRAAPTQFPLLGGRAPAPGCGDALPQNNCTCQRPTRARFRCTQAGPGGRVTARGSPAPPARSTLSAPPSCPDGRAAPASRPSAAAARKPGRQATRLRPRGVQAARHRRTLHQPLEAAARHRHPLREDRDHLPGRTPHRGHLPLGRSVIPTKRSRSYVPGGGRPPPGHAVRGGGAWSSARTPRGLGMPGSPPRGPAARRPPASGSTTPN